MDWMDKKIVIKVLKDVLEFIATGDTDVAWSHYETEEEAVIDLKAHIAKLENDDFSAIEDIKILFAPTGPLQEISLSNGWGNSFLGLAEKFDNATLNEKDKRKSWWKFW